VVDESATKAQGLDGFMSRIKAFSDVVAEMRAKRNAFKEKMDEIAQSATTAEAKLKAMNAALEQTLRLEGKEDEANKANALKRIEQRVAKGEITEKQAIIERGQVDRLFAGREADRENRRRAGIVQNLSNAQRAVRERIAGAQAELPGADKAEQEAAIAVRKAQAREEEFAAGGIFIGGKSMSLEEAVRQRNELLVTHRENLAHPNAKFFKAEDDRRAGQISELEQAITGFQVGKSQQAGLTIEARSRLERASGRTSRLRDTISTGTERLNDLTGQFEATVGAFNQEAASQSRVQETNRATAAINTTLEINERAVARWKRIEQKLEEVERDLGKIQGIGVEALTDEIRRRIIQKLSNDKVIMQSQ